MTTDSRHERAKRLFVHAIEIPKADREGFVSRTARNDDGLIAEVMQLLEHHDHPAAALRTVVERGERPYMAPPPANLGRYSLHELIGEGSTGRVFLATQEGPKRTVAVKLLRAGFQSNDRAADRFLREAELLARMDHPGIARVYESGIASLPGGAQAYIVMEHVPGLPLNRYAAAHDLTIPKKIELIAAVCDAVAYSHAHGILHRDLKPSNVLVDDRGSPRLIDFGLAFTLHDEHGTQPTLAPEIVGTLAYMSPEYASGLIHGSPTSDVYSLGVMAYELLSGRRPLEIDGLTIWEAMRVIREHRILPLCAITPRCGVDLDLVIRTALQTEPRDRYQTAADLAADLRRILAHRPISVRPRTFGYVAGRFLRRTRRRTILTAVGISLLVASNATAVRELFLARHRALATDLMADYSSRLQRLRASTSDTDKSTAQLVELSQRLRETLVSFPAVEARLQTQIATTLVAACGRLAEAERVISRSRTLLAQNNFDDALRSEIARAWLGIQAFRDRPHEVDAVATKLLAEAIDGRGEAELLHALHWALACRKASNGVFDAFNEHFCELERLAPLMPPERQRYIAIEHAVLKAFALLRAGRPVEAEQGLPTMDEIADALASRPGALVYRDAADLQASIQLSLGREQASERMLKLSLSATMPLFEARSSVTNAIRQRLAGLLWLKGDVAGAEMQFRELIDAIGPRGANDPVEYASALNSRGICLRDLGRLDEAEDVLQQALTIRLQTGGPESSVVADTKLNLASLYLRTGRGLDALRQAEEVARIREIRGERTAHKAIETLATLGRARASVHGPAAGLAALRAAWKARVEADLLTHWQTDVATEALIECLIANGMSDEARNIAAWEYSRLIELAGAESVAAARAAARLDRAAQSAPTDPGEMTMPGSIVPAEVRPQGSVQSGGHDPNRGTY